MFPLLYKNTISIDRVSINSLTSFLRADEVKVHAHEFLAVLFLLSEGATLPLECQDNVIVLKRKNNKNDFFRLYTKNFVYNDTKKITEEVVQTEAVEILRFFMDSASKDEKEEPKTEKDFEKGEFLDSPKFLIQTYLFEFISSIHDAEQFNQAVYDILSDIATGEMQINNLSREKSVSFLHDKCFISADSTEDALTYLNELTEIELIVTRYKFFIPSDLDVLPSSCEKDCHFCSIERFSNSSDIYNTVEVVLYTLFCCLLYNPETEKYSLEKIENPYTLLENFFTRYDRLAEKITSDTIDSWNGVIQYIPREKINYFEGCLSIDLCNVLLVLIDITGKANTEEEKKIIQFKEKLHYLHILHTIDYNDENSELQDFYKEVSEYIENMLTSLCVSDKMHISCRYLHRNDMAEIECTSDLFGMLVIKYTDSKDGQDSKESFITLKLYDRAAYALSKRRYLNSYIASKDKTLLSGIKKRLQAKENSFIQRLLIRCTDNICESTREDLQIFGDKTILINEIFENDLKDINRIFVLNNLNDAEYKLFIMGCSLSWVKENSMQLSPQSSIMKFTSNIVESLPSDDKYVQKEFTEIIAHTGHEKSLYPSFKFASNLEDISTVYFCDLDYIIYTNSTKVLIDLLKKHVKKIYYKTHTIFHSPNNLAEMFDCLFRYNSTQIIDSLKDFFLTFSDGYERGDKISSKNLICVVWFTLACQKKPENSKLIQEIYDYINVHWVLDKQINSVKLPFFMFYNENAKEPLEVLDRMEEELINRKGGRRKFKRVKQIFTSSVPELSQDSEEYEYSSENSSLEYPSE